MVRDSYSFTGYSFALTPDPACHFDPSRIDQIARQLLVLAAVRQQDHADAAQAAQSQDYAALLERLNTLESRVIEQERTIRHTMTILIEWIERDEAQVLAA